VGRTTARRVPLGHGTVRAFARERLRACDLIELYAPEDARPRYYTLERGVGAQVAVRRASGRAQARERTAAPPLLLRRRRRSARRSSSSSASRSTSSPTSTRRTIARVDEWPLVQGARAREGALGATSGRSGRCSASTPRSCSAAGSTGKPANADAARDARSLGGETHTSSSGLCAPDAGWESSSTRATRVTFRELHRRGARALLASGEWEGRAGAYAIQGLGAGARPAIEGDYLNVVGCPPRCSFECSAERFAGVYGFG
jgi:hypothetical protein